MAVSDIGTLQGVMEMIPELLNEYPSRLAIVCGRKSIEIRLVHPANVYGGIVVNEFDSRTDFSDEQPANT